MNYQFGVNQPFNNFLQSSFKVEHVYLLLLFFFPKLICVSDKPLKVVNFFPHPPTIMKKKKSRYD